MILPFDYTHDLDLCQEWEGRLTLYARDLSVPYMNHDYDDYFCVAMGGWVDVPDSGRVDLRRRHI